MAQHDYVLENQSGALFRQDLNNALNSIATNNMAATAPITTYPGMWWLDTSTNPATLRMRNNTNTAWINCGNLSELSYLAGVTRGIQAQLDEKVSTANLLNAVKAVDGFNSGLDADLVRGLPADFTALKSANGFQKLPSGLIIQWGSYSATAGALTAITFPIAFPTVCCGVQRNFVSSIDVGGVLSFSQITSTGFTARWNCFACSANPTVNHHWLSIGY